MNDREPREPREPQATARLARARARATGDKGLSGVDKTFTQPVDFPYLATTQFNEILSHHSLCQRLL